MRILQWNCNGLVAHGNELRHYLINNSEKYHVICLQETFLKPGKTFSLPGYSSVRRDREDGAKGGLITLVKEGLNYTELKISSLLECIIVKIKLRQCSLQIINMYISPGISITKNFFDSFSLDSHTVVVGDLNAKSRLWGSPFSDERGRLLEEVIDEKDIVVINGGQPTYQHHNGSQSHLDIAIVTSDLAARAGWSLINNRAYYG